MPQNLPEQILQRIVRLSTDDNSQREVARMLRVSQGCISKILRHNRETGRPHQRKRGCSMKISMPREDCQLLWMVRMNRFISAPCLRMQMIRRFGKWMSVQTIRRWLLTAGYWSRRRNFVYAQDNAPPQTARDTAAFFSGCWDHRLASSESRHEPNSAGLGSNVSLDMRHGWPPFHRSWTKQCSPPGVGCSSARKGVDPGREHASSCQGSSGR